MKLVGRYQSPFVRRIALVLHTLDLPYEHLSIAVADQDKLRAWNPVGRVPALVLDDGTVLVDSFAIVDWLAETALNGRSVLPAGGIERRSVLRATALLTAAIEKVVSGVYEKMRKPPEKVHEPFIGAAQDQARSGLVALESEAKQPWVLGETGPTLVDLSLAPAFDFFASVAPELVTTDRFPKLSRTAERVRQLQAYKATRPS